VRKEEDEVLFAIAEELGKFYTCLDNKLVLLPPLEVLCSVDETVVREQAVKSLSKIAESLSSTDMQNVFAQMVIRLSTTESLPSRVSSIGLLTPCYKRAGNQKEKLRKYL
jgi:serine/threonine-protein phosphatase 2A regulatory subunit A